MNKKMLKNVKRAICVALTAVFLVNTPLMEVSAAESSTVAEEAVEVLDTESYGMISKARTMLSNCIIVLSFSEKGMLIEITTGVGGTASVLGVKDVKVEKKVWYGWKTVAVASGAEYYNINSMGCSMLYSNAEVGATYRVSCVHYGQVDEYVEGENCTGPVVFTY